VALNLTDLFLGAFTLVGVAVLVTLGVLNGRRKHARENSLKKLATRRGWAYAPARDELAAHLPGPVFAKGQRRQCRNLIRTELGGLTATALDYSYLTITPHTTEDGQHVPVTTTFRLKVLVVELPQPQPRTSAAPAGLLPKLGIGLTGEPVAVGEPELDAGYQVRSADPEAARALLAPLAGTLLQRADQGLEADDTVLVLYRPGQQDPEDLEPWLDELAPTLAGLATRAG
jgi:hypothetical protein